MMANYKYRAKDGPSKIVEGVIEAPTQKEAVEKVYAMGYIPMSVEEGAVEAKAPAAVKRAGRVRSRDITVFSRQLASLLKAGVPILSSISVIAEQTDSAELKKILRDVYVSIKDGATFSSTLERYPRSFPATFVAMIKTGEDSGALPETLFRIADYRVKQEELVSRFRMAMAYPALMGMVGLGTIIFMLTFVMPRLMKLFTSAGQALPMPTKILIMVSSGLRQWWWAILIFLVLVFTGLKQQSKTKSGRLFFSMVKLKIPLFGPILLKAGLARFCRTMEILIKSGISILRATEISVPVVGNELVMEQLMKSRKELEQGGSFGKSLKSSNMFPLFMTNLIAVGEESGKLDEALGEVANSYERDTDEAVKTMSSLMEPLMILVMGLITGFIVVAMLLPIFEINAMVR